MSLSTHTIQLSETTYQQLTAVAQQQQLEIEALIEKFLETFSSQQKAPNQAHPFAYLLEIAEDLGVDDLAENHDHYLYGVEKR